MLAHGQRQIGDHFTAMQKDLEVNSVTNGYLGGSVYLSAADRTTRSEILVTMYFRSPADVHAFAHAPVHRDGWNWWNKETKKGVIPHLSISHELYDVPKGRWESVYANSHKTGLAGVHVPVVNDDGETVWRGTTVDANRSKFRSSKGRLTRSDVVENQGYDPDVYASRI